MSLKDVLVAVQKSLQFSKLVTVNGITYGLSVLSVEQEKKVNSLISSDDNLEGLDYYKMTKKELLCEAVVSINGETIGKVVKDTNAEGREVDKDKAIFLRGIFNDYPTAIIDKLFDAYVDIKEQAEEELKKGMKYDWFKSPEQRQKEADERQRLEDEKEKAAKAKEEQPKSEEKDVTFKKIEEPKEPVVPA
jgi:hypothetical protein